MVNMTADEELLFAKDVLPEGSGKPREHLAPWRILIVDDDPDVHTTTSFALRGTEILGRSLAFLHADSAEQARKVLGNENDIAVILLDVVMEEEDSGLKLVRVIREQLGMLDTRIILRTGQPGYAPEMDAIRDYDINDYKTKSELTRNKLFTALTSAIRSYRQIRTINSNRHGLDLIVRASGELLALSGIRNFAAGVITQMSALLGIMPEGLICVRRPPESTPSHSDDTVVIAAAGRYASLINLPIEEIGNDHVYACLNHCLDLEQHVFGPDYTTLFFGSRSKRNMAAYLDAPLEIDDSSRQLLEVFCTNISVGLENTLLFSQLHEFAYFDSLTGLPNRRSLINKLDERLLSGERGRYSLALMDLDAFAETNDALGHQYGDELLKAVAERIRSTMGPQCTLARLSADTFAILGQIEQLLPAKLLGIFRDPFLIQEHELMISCTMGIAHLADIDGNGAEALKDAYLALRRAKSQSRGEYVLFSRDMATEIRERSRLLQALRIAIERQRLFLCYQPQICLRDGHVIGMEALLRWRTDEGAMISPDRFIPIAEHSGLIVGIGDWVLRMSCFQQAELTKAGFQDLSVGVNVSMGQFRHPRFLSSLQSALADSGANPTLIELEITESMAMEEADLLARTIDSIKALGVRIAVDDFGTGFSSLSYLQRLQVDRLKIDKAFVAEIEKSERARRIPELVIQLGHKLGLTVMAEGVETLAQAEILTSLGCEDAQGFHYAMPMEPDKLIDWLRTYTARIAHT